MSRLVDRSVGARKLVAAAALTVTGISAAAYAAPISWDNGGNDSKWGTNANWIATLTATNDTPPGTGDSAVFTKNSGITLNQAIDTGANRTVQGINIGNNDTVAGAVNNFSINNNTLLLSGGVTGLRADGTQTNQISGSTIIQIKSGVTAGGTVGEVGTYTINSNIGFSVANQNGNPPQIYNGDSAATVIVNGVMSSVGPRRGFAVGGGGTVLLTNPNNSYIQNTSVYAGTLMTNQSAPATGTTSVFGSATNTAIILGSTDTAETPSGATISLLATDGTNIARNLNIINSAAATVAIGGGPLGTTPATFSGTVTLAHALNLRSNGSGLNTVDITGQITGTGNITKTQGGTVRVSNTSNNYVGNTQFNTGTLLLGAAGVIPDASELVFNGGTLATGGFSENAGLLRLSNSSKIDFGGAGILSLSGLSLTAWNAAATLQLLNWNGVLDDTGTMKFIVGASLSPDQLAAIDFIDPAGFAPGTYDATQLPSGQIVPVPEPTSLALLGIAAAPAVLRRRRCRDVAAR